MRAPSLTRRIACVAALAAVGLAPATASATQVVPILSETFSSGADGWTSTSACAPLCTVANAVDSGAGGAEPGSATINYTTLAGLLGGLATGTSTWTSPTFTWSEATPDTAVLSYARKAAIGGLLTAGGSATERVQLHDLTSGVVATISAGGISTADTGFADRYAPVNAALLVPGHSYRLSLTTDLAAGALLSGIRVSYDDIALSATLAAGTAVTSGSGNAGSQGGTGTTMTAAPGSGTGSTGALSLVAAAVLRYRPGQPMQLRVRALRAGKPLAGALVTLHWGTTTRVLATGRDGYAALKLTRRTRTPVRVTFRLGASTVATWARPR